MLFFNKCSRGAGFRALAAEVTARHIKRNGVRGSREGAEPPAEKPECFNPLYIAANTHAKPAENALVVVSYQPAAFAFGFAALAAADAHCVRPVLLHGGYELTFAVGGAAAL